MNYALCYLQMRVCKLVSSSYLKDKVSSTKYIKKFWHVIIKEMSYRMCRPSGYLQSIWTTIDKTVNKLHVDQVYNLRVIQTIPPVIRVFKPGTV